MVLGSGKLPLNIMDQKSFGVTGIGINSKCHRSEPHSVHFLPVEVLDMFHHFHKADRCVRKRRAVGRSKIDDANRANGFPGGFLRTNESGEPKPDKAKPQKND